MRGKDSGSEHEHETAWAHREADAEGSATPPTPPPSFGQTPASGLGQPPADDGTAWAPDAAGTADRPAPPAVPYPTRYGLPGGLRAPEPAADDPESTNRFRAVPAYGPPPPSSGVPGDARSLPAPRPPGDEGVGSPAPGEPHPGAVPPQPAYGGGPHAWQPPEGQGVHTWQPQPGQGDQPQPGQGDQRQPGYGPPAWQPPAPAGPAWQPTLDPLPPSCHLVHGHC
ncbi:hypothetical protein [Microbispora sp. NPDC049633]|uniref:hypothetical protein n=1 Tax=Microbispora sp. NPDC049633 TaxID=3154355 RepID=UPI0034349DF4